MRMKESKFSTWLRVKAIGALLLFSAFAFPLLAQTVTVRGTVTLNDGEPIIGATVVVQGSEGQGTATDFDGNYTLPNVRSNANLVFSYMGMKSQVIPVNGRTTIDVVMLEDSELLSEVVVTALGMKREQKALGYAVTEVKGDEIKGTNTINPVAALQGKIAGVDIKGTDGGLFGGTKIQIRGASTLQNNNQPIYVVDGVILDNEVSGNATVDWDGNHNSSDWGNVLKNLNPDDFESVSVLKGAAATALYGSRGLNGAVVITTKGGRKTQGLGVAFSQTFGIDHVFDTPNVQYKYGPGMWPGQNSSDPDGNRWNLPDLLKNSDGMYSLIQSGGMMWGPEIDGREVELYDKTIGTWQAYPNNLKDMYDTGFNSNTNLSIQGGNADTNIFTSISYRTAKGISPKNRFDRFSFFTKGFHQITDWVSVGASVNWTRSKPQNSDINFGEYFVQLALTNDYNPAYYKDKYQGEHGGIANNAYGDLYGNVPGRDLWFSINHNNSYRLEDVIRPTLEFDFKLTDWAKFKLEGNMNYYTVKSETKNLGGGYANEGGYYGISQRAQESITLMSTLMLNKNFGDFDLGGFVRGEFFNRKNTYTAVWTKGGLIVPGQFFIGNSKETPGYEGGVNDTKRIYSTVFAVNAAWKNQLFMDVTGRNDWSSALVYSNATGNFSYFYPSVSGSWIFTESFNLPKWFTFGKLRASWAQVGNDTRPYYINQAYSIGSIELTDGFAYTNGIPGRLFDPNIKPERKNAWEVGLDLRFINNRIGIDATYYKENTKDQIIEIAVPWISGVSSQLINAGNIQNQGVELALKTIPVQTKDFEWSLDLTYTRNRNKIVELHPNVTNYIGLEGYPTGYDFNIGSVALVGGPYGVLMSNIGQKKNENGDVVLKWSNYSRGAYPARSEQVEEVGNLNPDFLSSLQTGVRYKNFNLRIALDARFGGMIASYANRYGTAYGALESSLAFRDAASGGITWTSQYQDSYGITYNDGVIPEGVFDEGTTVQLVDGTTIDASGMSYADLVAQGKLEPTHAGSWHYFSNSWGQGTLNDNWFHELNYIALREISLGYNFDKKLLSKTGINGLHVLLSARNLGYLHNSLPNNLHPESVRGNRTGEFRSRALLPYTANYILTLNFTF